MERVTDKIQGQVRDALTSSRPLFHARIEVGNHVVKKNGKTIKQRRNRAGGFQKYIGNTQAQINAQDFLVLELRRRTADIGFGEPLTNSLWAMFLFFYPKDRFFTRDGKLSRKLPDLSNLYELPQDALQKAGVIKNDNLIRSHDLSRILPSPDENHYVEIFLMSYDESKELEQWKK